MAGNGEGVAVAPVSGVERAMIQGLANARRLLDGCSVVYSPVSDLSGTCSWGSLGQSLQGVACA
jgi:hypothetical protein